MKVRLIAIASAIAAAVAISTPAAADCAYPKSPDSAPNGTTATEAEMIAGKQAYDKYQNDVNSYLECLDKEANDRAAAVKDNADQVKQIKSMANKKHDAAIDELQARAEEFNSQLRAYKNKHKS
jgi:hypothetical protein